MRDRIGQLHRLGTHRGSAEVVCAAHCTGKAPMVHWKVVNGDRKRRMAEETRFRNLIGKPPIPRPKYEKCIDGRTLCDQLLRKSNGWRIGYIKATFEIGEMLSHLFHPAFDYIWLEVGKPPGWEDFQFDGRLKFPF